ncbi:DUF4406 domain-containing protein [bacterium SCSIO 12741]|nr:DUF4406 domain-containing protein [bacterium SCSIO 12741]
MWIMISGPYRSGSSDPAVWAQNLEAMNKAAFQVFQKGHVPVIGVNGALPIIKIAGEQHYDSLMMPISMALADRCDAVWRIGGPSKGADEEMNLFIRKGLPVYRDVNSIPMESTHS